jgi:hypothetical protein
LRVSDETKRGWVYAERGDGRPAEDRARLDCSYRTCPEG